VTRLIALALRLSVGLMLTLATAVQAGVPPHPGPGDSHIQSIDYDPEQVVELRVAPGYAVTVEFSPDERIENVSVGNSAAWQATPNRRADHLFIKPVQAGISTNLTVITDARRYNFDLVTAYGPEPGLPYIVRFTYPVVAAAAETVIPDEPTRYRLGGDRALRPAAMSDDGKFTAIVFPPDATLPAIYSVDAAGHEAIVNGAMRDGAYMIEGIAPRFIFRIGKARATAQRLTARRKR
jgi:type IV secretion system protein VirB9